MDTEREIELCHEYFDYYCVVLYGLFVNVCVWLFTYANTTRHNYPSFSLPLFPSLPPSLRYTRRETRCFRRKTSFWTSHGKSVSQSVSQSISHDSVNPSTLTIPTHGDTHTWYTHTCTYVIPTFTPTISSKWSRRFCFLVWLLVVGCWLC